MLLSGEKFTALDVELKVKRYQEIAIILAVLVHLLLPFNLFVFMGLLKWTVQAFFAAHLTLQALSILNVFLGSWAYKLYLRNRALKLEQKATPENMLSHGHAVGGKSP